MNQLKVGGLEHQLALWKDMTQDAAVAMVGPLGCGKTYGLAVKQAMLRILNKGIDGLLVVPTYKISQRVHVKEWPRIWEGLGLHVTYQHGQSAFRWPWGDRTWIGTAENPESLVGPNLGDVTFDEPGLMSVDAWERGSTRARHPKAKCRQKILGGTPEGINWFADLFADPRPPYRTIWARSWHADMAHYPEQLRQTYGYDESLYATYGGGRFVPLRMGRAWRFYDPAKHLGTTQYSSSLPLVLACDFNVDALRWEIGQFYPSEIQWMDEIALGQDGSTEQGIREFVRRWGPKNPSQVVVTGDASGKARSTSGKTDYQIIMEELKANGIPFRLVIPAGNPRVKDRVDNSNYHLAGRGRRVVVDKRCKELRLDWERTAWKKGQPELDKTDPLRTHSAEAADYAVWMLARSIRNVGAGNSGASSPPFSAATDPALGAEF